jgi:hypothetical protein
LSSEFLNLIGLGIPSMHVCVGETRHYVVSLMCAEVSEGRKLGGKRGIHD